MRILWFILLKVVEIGGVVFGPHYLGRLVHRWTEFFCITGGEEITHVAYWVIGLGSLVLVLVAICGGALVTMLLIGNWELAGKIRDRF